MTRPKQFNGEVLIRFSPIVAWKFQINLVGSFSFIVFSIYKMIESQPSTLTAANIWIETWLGKKHSNIWKIERQTNVLLNGIVRSKGKSCKKCILCQFISSKMLYFHVSDHLLCVWHHICTIVLYFENSISNLTFILLWSYNPVCRSFLLNIFWSEWMKKALNKHK